MNETERLETLRAHAFAMLQNLDHETADSRTLATACVDVGRLVIADIDSAQAIDAEPRGEPAITNDA